MQYSTTLPTPSPLPQSENKPFLASFDSAREFSFDHWMEVSWLVEQQQEEFDGYVFEDSLLIR